jgi:hypothetical protein
MSLNAQGPLSQPGLGISIMADEVGVAQVKPLGNSTSLTLTYSAELIDRCIGSRIWIILKSKKEFTGVLLGFDDYVSTIPFPLSHCLMTGYRHGIGRRH